MVDQPSGGLERLSHTLSHTQSESSKRVRVSQACELCRSRKSKCDGERPACSTCRGLLQPCMYDPNPKKRGIPAGQSTALERRILTMELVSSLLMDCLDDDANQIVRSFLTLDQDPSMAEVESWNDKATALLERWKAGPMSEWVQEMSARSDVIDDLSQSRSHAIRSLSISNSVGRDEISSTERQKESTAPAHYHQRIEALRVDSDIPSKCPVHRAPGHTQKYLDTYFAYIHNWLPLVDKFKIMSFAQHTLSDRGSIRLSSQESGNLALLWAIIACASPHLSEQPSSEAEAEAETISSGTAYLNARSLLPADDSDFKLEHTQALILLSLSQFWHGSWKSSWVLIGLAGRLAVEAKAPSNKLSHSYHLLSSERRTRLACFVVEGLIAAYLGRETQHVSLRSLSPKPHAEEYVRWQLEEDGWEEWSNWAEPDAPSDSSTSILGHLGPSRTLSTFNHLVRLIESMNKMLSTTYVFDDSQNLRKFYVAISEQLYAWYSNLERSYPFLGISKSQKPLIHVMNLHLIYWSQRCMLYIQDPVAEAGSNSTTELSDRSNHLASKVNEIIMLYKTSYKITLSSLIISNAVAAAVCLVDSSSTLGVQLREYMEEIQQTWRPVNSIDSSERSPVCNESFRKSYDPLSWNRGLPKTVGMEELMGAQMVMPNSVGSLEKDSQSRLWPVCNGSHDHLSPRRILRSKTKQPARAARRQIQDHRRSLQVDDHDVTGSNSSLHLPLSDQPQNNFIRNLPQGEVNLVPALNIDPEIDTDPTLFNTTASGAVSDHVNSNGTSGHDLTFLDAMSWTDHSLAKNFGYVGDFSDAQELYGNLEEFSFDLPNLS